MTETNKDFCVGRNIKEFEVNYDRFDEYTIEVLRTIKATNQWVRTREDVFLKYIRGLFHLYLNIVHRRFHDLLGHPPLVTSELLMLGMRYQVPRFLRDIFREIARPMTIDKTIYIPKVEIQSWIGEDYVDYETYLETNALYRLVDVDAVPLEEEILRCAPFSVYSARTKKLFFALEPSLQRREAVGLLQFLHFKEVDIAPQSGSQVLVNLLKEISSHMTRGLIDETTSLINGRRFWTYEHIDNNNSHYYLCARFPTEENFPGTPPGPSKGAVRRRGSNIKE
nr:coat protein [Saccharomyces cerevisiae partitivirus 1]WGH28810.1 coat protein [Saccharomyces cerevisiae partitivirus 1]WGJ63526.1 coat protein [Saccharomyces cerevisiae partitivirus 1]